MVGERSHTREEFAGIFLHREAEEIFDLGRGDQQGDAVGEADDDGARDEAHGGTQAGEAEEEQNHAGHHGDHEESGEAVFGEDSGDDDHEGAGGAADLDLRSAQERD